MKHGELTDNGSGRWCEVCNQKHGCLYRCNQYHDETLAHIDLITANWVKNLNDKEWCQEQIENGTDSEAIAIMKFFAGVK